MKIVLTLVLALSVISCSVSNRGAALYKSSSSAPSLVIPPDLTSLDDTENRYLPSSNLGTRSAISAYKETGPLLDRVLPKIAGVSLQGDGDFHWLRVEQNTTHVYDSLRLFWSEEGFILEQDEPLIGILKTEWLENKAGLLFADDSFFSKMLSSLSSTDTRDQYKTRIEKGESENISNVYLTQKGQEFMLVDSEDSASVDLSGWQSRPSESELEVEMLSRMMLFLGLQDDNVKSQLAKIGKFPARARLTKGEEGQASLVVIESFERTWNRTLLALDRLDIEYLSKNKDDAIIKLKKTVLEKKKKEAGFLKSLFASDESKEEGFVVLNISLEETSSQSTQIVVFKGDVVDSSDQAIALLQYLYDSLK